MSDPPRRRVVEVSIRRPELLTVRVAVEAETDPDDSYLDELPERRSEYKRGKFHLVSVRIYADVLIEGTTQTLSSPGLPGVESDYETDELAEILTEEWRALRSVLKTIGVPTSQLPSELDEKWMP